MTNSQTFKSKGFFLESLRHCTINRFCRLSGACCLVEQYVTLKSKFRAYVEAFKVERKNRKKLQEKIEEYKKRVEDQETSIKKMTSQLHAYMTFQEINRWSENAYLGQAGRTPMPHVRFIHPYYPTDEPIAQADQQEETIFPWNGRQ